MTRNMSKKGLLEHISFFSNVIIITTIIILYFMTKYFIHSFNHLETFIGHLISFGETFSYYVQDFKAFHLIHVDIAVPLIHLQ